MIEDLLFITKDLLFLISSSEFTKEEEEYMVKVIKKTLLVLTIEWHKTNKFELRDKAS